MKFILVFISGLAAGILICLCGVFQRMEFGFLGLMSWVSMFFYINNFNDNSTDSKHSRTGRNAAQHG